MIKSESFVASLDVGTTTIRCIILNSTANIIGSARATVKLIYPKPGYVEIDPNQILDQVIQVVKSAISDAKLTSGDIKCLGIATQRATFITWHRDTGKPFHNFITWKDLRAKDLCKELNASLVFKSFRYAAYALYIFTRNQRFLTGSRLKVAANHVTGRLLWTLKYVPQLKACLAENKVMFGTMDSWLLYQLTGRKLHVSDISNASCTGLFDPFILQWSAFCKSILGIPEHIFPQVVDNDFDYGCTADDLFGSAIPIKCVMADQSSSMFASCSFTVDDLKITMGTGAFFDVNTGLDIHTSVTGIYPLISWKLGGDMVRMGEVACSDCGSLVEWLLSAELINNPAEINKTALSVDNSDGVYFIPAFSGFGSPINDERAASGFIGIKPTTTSKHLVRSVLEGIIYRVVLAYRTLKEERSRDYVKITVDGGVSRNDFVCQKIADLTGLTVERLHSTELSVLGVGFAAGIATGIWKNQEVLKTMKTVEKSFKPMTDSLDEFNRWFSAVQRFTSWYVEE